MVLFTITGNGSCDDEPFNPLFEPGFQQVQGAFYINPVEFIILSPILRQAGYMNDGIRILQQCPEFCRFGDVAVNDIDRQGLKMLKVGFFPHQAG